uniref:Adenosine deaminase acting on RNA type2g n=1 Tax=Homo sapiens TaxID=9606 RepID=Q4AE81_HUMAN|nr:adenosine deaminase acting on RNA type2g [Homo sapiens]
MDIEDEENMSFS